MDLPQRKALSEARKRANEKWRAAHKDYFANYYRNKYQSDDEYRNRCKEACRRRRSAQTEINQIMSIQV